MKHVFIFGLVLCFVKFNKCFPHDSQIISKYAKVAVWKNNNTDSSSGNKIKSGNLWNHRLDTNDPTSKTKNPSVVYQYPIYQKPDSKVDKKTEHVPGIGEVIVASAQDRFEARPHFAYKGKASPTYLPPPAPKPSDTPAASYLTSSTGASAVLMAAPNVDLYNSPYSSYNPPDFKPDDSQSNEYPPNNHNYGDSGPSIPLMKDSSPKAITKGKAPDSYVSLGPPIAPHNEDHPHDNDGDNLDYDHDHDNDHSHQSDFEPYHYHHDFQQEKPPVDPMTMYKQKDGPPHPPKGVDDVYYPPDFPQDQIPHNHGGAHDDHMIKDDMMVPNDMMAPEDMMPTDDIDEGKSSGSGDDHIQAPPSPPFPHYLYDQHHYDHHIYEEIPHTTMVPTKEEKRVSSTHYSYYYLGRKLWYIPLYFSIYFIIYVTVLIVKSIARHKVKLKYKWYEHDNGKEARSLNFNDVKEEEVTEVHRIVGSGLRNATSKYESILAMK
ncbi:uncharacterized protein [Euwallacea fornicatus]|uniref:uncharacterized protein n=1 Tax=Euwallacea fornicatus TaxID=995702 RepID=UPI00338EFEEE